MAASARPRGSNGAAPPALAAPAVRYGLLQFAPHLARASADAGRARAQTPYRPWQYTEAVELTPGEPRAVAPILVLELFAAVAAADVVLGCGRMARAAFTARLRPRKPADRSRRRRTRRRPRRKPQLGQRAVGNREILALVPRASCPYAHGRNARMGSRGWPCDRRNCRSACGAFLVHTGWPADFPPAQEEPTSQFPLLKIWLLTLPVSSSLVDSEEAATPHLTLLRSSPISPTPGRPSPVSSLAVSPSLSHIIAGLADGSVVGWKRVDELIDASLYDLEEAAARANEPPPGVVVASTSKLRSVVGAGASRTFQPGNLGKLRVFWEGNKEPITNLGFTLPAGAAATAATAAAVPTLFILTTSQILALPLAVKSKAQAPPSVLDDHGAAVGCARVVSLGGGKGAVGGDLSERMVVARDEAIYVYGTEGREGCWAYEGEASLAVPETFQSLTVLSLRSQIFDRRASPGFGRAGNSSRV